MRNLGALGVGICGIGLFTYLLVQGNIHSVAYTALSACVLFLSYVISRSPSVPEVDLKALKVTLHEVQQLKSDVYAKAEAVQRLAEQTARFVARSVSAMGHFPDEHLTERMLRQRDEIGQMLQEVGTNAATTEEIVRHINDVVERDLRTAAWQSLAKHINNVNGQRGENNRLDRERFRILIMERYDRAQLTRLLQSDGITVPGLEGQLDAVDKFRQTKKL